MKVSVKVTLEGLIRALRSHMHQLADSAETIYVGRKADPDFSDRRPRAGKALNDVGDL